MSFDNSNRGAIWGNDDRQKDSHPHFKGKANIDGVEYYVSAWKRGEDAKPRAPALSFSFVKVDDVKNKSMDSAKSAVQAPQSMDSLDDNLPF